MYTHANTYIYIHTCINVYENINFNAIFSRTCTLFKSFVHYSKVK